MSSESINQRVGIQAVSLGGSFHEIAVNELGYPSEQLVPFPHHEALLHGVYSDNIDKAVYAIDNTRSGRVQTAISALAGARGVHIIEVIDIPVPQRVLRHPDTPRQNIKNVISQIPALDQCRQYIACEGWEDIEESDTLLAAQRVAESHGIIDGMPTVALASEMAGRKLNLVIEDVASDDQDSTTRFWVLSKQKDWDESGSHSAFTFEVPNRQQGLHGAVDIISGQGYDITDIDSHLTPATVDKRAFFAEVENNGHNIKHLMKKLRQSNITSTLLGVYDSSGPLIIDKTGDTTPPAVNHDHWRATSGLTIEDGSDVVYIGAKNKPKSLLGMLNILKITSIHDMSRPIAANENRRGFYFVLDKDTERELVVNILAKLKHNGYEVESLEYTNGRVHETE